MSLNCVCDLARPGGRGRLKSCSIGIRSCRVQRVIREVAFPDFHAFSANSPRADGHAVAILQLHVRFVSHQLAEGRCDEASTNGTGVFDVTKLQSDLPPHIVHTWALNPTYRLL